MNKTILEFCNEINSNPKLKSEMTNKILEYCKNNNTSQSKINIINEIILPTATKMGFDFSAEELLDHENNVKNELTLEDLESVSGGVGVKAKVMSLFATLNLSAGILAGSTAFAINQPNSSPITISASNSTIKSVDVDQSILDTSSSTSQSENNSNNTSSNALTQVKAKQDAAGENQAMSREETMKAVIEDIAKELKNSSFDFKREANKNDLHNLNADDDISKAIKNFSEKSKEIAKILDQKSSFKSLKQLISSGDNKILDDTFVSLRKLSPRENVAEMLILDDWAALNNVSHNTSVIASPYFIDKEGKPIWPDNRGYKKDAQIKNIIDDMKTGYEIDRYGSEYGFYVCPANNNASVSYAKRALANRENKNFYHKYTVTRNFSELKTVIKELGLDNCLELEKQAVNIYIKIKDQIKTKFQIQPSSHPYSKEDYFNYQQLKGLIDNKGSIDEMLIPNANVNQVKEEFNKLKTILSQYDEVFKTAKTNAPDKEEKIQTLQDSIKRGYINLNDNLNCSQVYSGTIAPAFKQEGGGEQIELPFSVSLLKSLGFLQDAKN